MSTPVPTVDFHTHYMPRTIETFRAGGCTSLVIESPTCGQLYNGSRHYRTIDDRTWDATRRIGDMDRRGIALQVLSPIPVTNAYEATGSDGATFARLHNEGIAEAVRARPDRFAGLGAVPLQDVDAACDELNFLVADLGLLGVEIGTTAAGRELDDPELVPFWERCDALRAVVFIHPETAPGFERLRAHGLTPSTAYPTETGLVAAKILMAGYLQRFSNVTVVLAHGGGTLPWLLPRLDRVWETLPVARDALPERPSSLARSFYCDTLTFDAANLALIARRIGVTRLLIGSDYPFPLMEDPPGSVLDDMDFDAESQALIRNGTFREIASRVTGGVDA